MKKRILVADDHPIVRAGLVNIINSDPDVCVAAEASTCRETLEKVRSESYDLLVLDITMPDGSGLDVLKEVARTQPKLAVLMLSIHPGEQYAIRTLKAGAWGYLTKNSAPDELVDAVKTIIRGRKYISPGLAEYLAAELSNESDKLPHEMLSDREYEVMLMLAGGKSNKQIAVLLQLSEKTISTHRARIWQKMGVGSNAELARHAVENGLL